MSTRWGRGPSAHPEAGTGRRARLGAMAAVASAADGVPGRGPPAEVIHLNVGGKRFSTSRQTLTWIPDSFFSSLLSGRISTLKDETGAVSSPRAERGGG